MHRLGTVLVHDQLVPAGHAIFGDDQIDLRIAVMHTHQRVVQALRVDVPSHVGVRTVGRQPIDVGGVGAGGRAGLLRELRTVAHVHTIGGVIVDAEHIDRLVRVLQVTRLYEAPVTDALGDGEQFVRVAAT